MRFNFNRKQTRVTKTRRTVVWPAIQACIRGRERAVRVLSLSGRPDSVPSSIKADPVATTSDKCIRHSAVKG
jgi:hypothetical protein